MTPRQDTFSSKATLVGLNREVPLDLGTSYLQIFRSPPAFQRKDVC